MLSSRRHFATLALSTLFLGLVACGGRSGLEKKQINPPRASVQQLTVLANGQWRLVLRLQNFSNRATKFEAVNARLKFDGQDAGAVSATPGIDIGPQSADTVETIMTPSLEAKVAVASALSAGQSTRYRIAGTIDTTQRDGDYDFEYESALNPAPGLPGVLR
jgi:hypothetical protein